MTARSRLLWLGCALGLAIHCRIERTDAPRAGDDDSQPAPVAARAPARVVTVGMGAAEAHMVFDNVCEQLLGSGGSAALARALEQVECARRARGLRYAGASLVAEDGRWGAVTGVAPAYLASTGASRAFVQRVGMRQGADPLQSLSPCELASPGPDAASAAQPAARTPEAAPRAEPTVDDDDAGVADAEGPGAAVPPRTQVRDPGALISDGEGHYVAATLHAALDGTEGSWGKPMGLDLTAGQAIFAGPAGAVFAVVSGDRNPAVAPAPAADLYAAVLQRASLVLPTGVQIEEEPGERPPFVALHLAGAELVGLPDARTFEVTPGACAARAGGDR